MTYCELPCISVDKDRKKERKVVGKEKEGEIYCQTVPAESFHQVFISDNIQSTSDSSAKRNNFIFMKIERFKNAENGLVKKNKKTVNNIDIPMSYNVITHIL